MGVKNMGVRSLIWHKSRIWGQGYGIWDMGYGIWDMGYGGQWDMGVSVGYGG